MTLRKDLLVHYLLLALSAAVIGCPGSGSDATPPSAPGNALPDTAAPTAPGDLRVAAPSPSEINLSWSASTDDVGVAGYRIYRDGSFLVSANATSAADNGLTASTRHCYTVSALDAAGNESAHSGEACATTLDPVPPAPSNLVAIGTSASIISLLWADDSAVESGFKIERSSISASAGFAQIVTTEANQATYVDVGLNPSTQYWYRVRAYNGSGESGYSNVAGAVTLTPDLWDQMKWDVGTWQ